MSALSTPGGGGTTAQTKPTSGKQKFQKLDINSLYCANKNENSEPSSVKSQLSRKHGMQSLGKVPSARRPPANLPSLKTETGQDPNANSISATTATTPTPATCNSQTITTTSNSNAGAATGSGGWVPLPPPSSPHFRTEFPSLEASAQPAHRAADHSAGAPQLRPQTEGSWTCGGTAGGAPAAPAAAAPAVAAQPPTFRTILPSFLMKGSTGGGIGLGTLGNLRETRPSGGGGGGGGAGGGGGGGGRTAPRAAPPQSRAVEVLTARPILRDEQISSLDDIRDAGWAQHDDIDYDQKLDFSDGESSAPSGHKGKSHNRSNADNDRDRERDRDAKLDAGDEEQIWAERRQKQSNEVAAAVARAKQRKEEEMKRQRDSSSKESHPERDRDTRDKERLDNRDRDRMDPRDRDRDRFDRERAHDRDRDRVDNRDRDRDRDRDRADNRDGRARNDRDRADIDKDRMDRNDNRDRGDRDRYDRDRSDRDRQDRDKMDRDRDRDRDFRDRDRDYGRERERGGDRERDRDRDASNPAFSKMFQANIPPRFLKQQQQSRQQDEQQHSKGWAFSGKSAPRRQDPPRHAPHNGRRSYSRDYSDREDDFRREKEGSGPQWRSEMQDYERQNSKDSYKDYDYKDRRSDSDRKSADNAADHSSRTSAAEKLSEVFERKSVGLAEPFGSDSSQQPAERRHTPPSNASQRESAERDYGQVSWAEASIEEHSNYTILKSDKVAVQKQVNNDHHIKESVRAEMEPHASAVPSHQAAAHSLSAPFGSDPQPLINKYQGSQASPNQNYIHHNQQTQNTAPSSVPSQTNSSSSLSQSSFCDNQSISKSVHQPISKPSHQNDISNNSQIQKQAPSEQLPQHIANKPVFSSQKSDKDISESESIASKSSTDPAVMTKINDKQTVESHHGIVDAQKRSSISADEKRVERFGNEQNKIQGKEPIERKSSGSGSEKKGRGYGSGGYAVYNRGWGRESRGRRSHRSSRSNNRASESDGSTDGAPNADRKERRRAPRSPRGPNKVDDAGRPLPADQAQPPLDTVENREPFAPRGQPSRRGRGGFQGTSRPPAPAKRVTGYGPPNTKSPFSQANRAVKDDEIKDGIDDKSKMNKQRTGSSIVRGEGGRGRDRRAKGAAGGPSGEDENWETTSEHSESGTGGRRRSVGGRAQKAAGGRNQNVGGRQNNRNVPGGKSTASADVTEAMSDLKLVGKKDEELADDGFQEVRNKKATKDVRGPPVKEDNQGSKTRSHSNQGGGRNGSTSRNPNDKPISRGSAPVPNKPGSQYDRPRQSILPPRFVKQRQKQQMGLVSSFGPDTGAAPPPPPVNAWDKPISQSLRGNVEEPVPEVVDNKSAQSSQRSTPGDASIEINKTASACALAADKTGVLDGTTPPVETIIFENTNYKTAPPAEALKQKYQPCANSAKPPVEELPAEVDARQLAFNGDVRAPPPRSIQELIAADSGRQVGDAEGLGLQMSFESAQKAEDSSDMKLDFAFDSDLGQLTEDKTAKALGLPRGTHMSTSNTISPLAADLNLKIASVKKVWEMPAVAEGSEDMQFSGFEEANTETGAPPNVCKVKPTQQLQSPPPQHYNHVGYQGGYGGLSVPSPPAVLFNSSQQLLGSSQQLPQQGGLYGAFLDQSRGQFGGFPGSPYGAGSGAPFNYQPTPDMFQTLPSQYRMAAAGGGAAFGQSGQLGNSPSTVLISSTSNSLMSASVKPSSQQIGAIGSKGGGVGGVGVGGVGGVGGVNTYQQQYLGYSGPVGEAGYSLQGMLPRPAPPANSYYSPYQPAAAAAPSYPLQFTQQPQSGAFSSQFLSSQLQVAAAVQQMQQYRQPMQQQYAPQPRPPPQQLKSPLHEHANGFAPLCDSGSPTPKGAGGGGAGGGGGCGKVKPPHSPPQHKYQHPPPPHTPHQHTHHHHQHPHQMVGMGNNNRGGNGNPGMSRNMASAAAAAAAAAAARYPTPIQRPHAPAPMYRPAPPTARVRPPYYHQRNSGSGGGGGGGVERGGEAAEPGGGGGGGAEPADGDSGAAAVMDSLGDNKPE